MFVPLGLETLPARAQSPESEFKNTPPPKKPTAFYYASLMQMYLIIT